MTHNIKKLRQKIKNKKAVIGIIGLGYVGLPLALTFAKKGFNVIGIEIDKERIRKIRRGVSYITDVSNAELKDALKKRRFRATEDSRFIKKLDAVIICVPTPLGENREPDISYIREAVAKVKENIQKGQIVVLESTTYPGTTREILLPILESTGLKEGKDFYLAFSPERIDPGNEFYKTENTPKVIGGISRKSTWIAKFLYDQIINEVVSVSSASAAEMVKLLENTFRIVNIALVNEIALLCNKFELDIWEIIDAAKTKPYGYMPFYPGPGVGGHCLSGSETIFVKDEQGFKLLKISDFADKLLKDLNIAKHRAKGVLYLKPKGLQTISFNRFTKKGCLADINIVSKRNYKGKVVSIFTSDKRKVEVTDKHPLFVFDGEMLKTKFAKDIKEKERLVISLDPKFGGINRQTYSIDLIEYLTEEQIKRIRVRHSQLHWSLFKRNISSDVRMNCRKYINSYYDWFRNNAIPLCYFIEAEKRSALKVDRRKLLLCTGRGPSYSQIMGVLDINKDMCRLIGYYLSEGCITQDKSLRTRFVFSTEEKEYIDDLLKILDSMGIKYSMYHSKEFKSACIKISSTLFGIFLRDILKCGKDSYTMKIPSEIFLLSKECRINLLAGLLRGDGGVDYSIGRKTYRKNNKTYNHRFNTCAVNYYTANPALFQQVVLLLQSFGIVPSFKKRENFLNIFGYKQISKVKNFFLGRKLSKINTYLKMTSKIISNKTFDKYRKFATVKVKEIKHHLASQPVYSMELRGPNALVTSFGIIVHNCIPVDPLYLSWKAKEHGFETKFIDLASSVNESMPQNVIERLEEILSKKRKTIDNSNILIIGVAYKKDVKDLRESPAISLINLLQKKGAEVSYYDPYFPFLKINSIDMKPIKLHHRNLKRFDCALIMTDHSNIDYRYLAYNLKLIFDTRNIFNRLGIKSKNIIKL